MDMDFLRSVFPLHDPLRLHRAFIQADGNVEAAIDTIFTEIDDLQSKALRQAESRPLAIELEDPLIQRPLLSPSSSADSLQGLTISDADDSDDLNEDPIVPLGIRRSPTPQQQQQGRNEAGTPGDELQQNNDPSPDECLAGVLAIFPDACTEHVRKQYNENHPSEDGNIIDLIARQLAQYGYPRAAPEPKVGLKRKRPVTEEEEDEEGAKEYEAEHRTVSDKYTSFV